MCPEAVICKLSMGVDADMQERMNMTDTEVIMNQVQTAKSNPELSLEVYICHGEKFSRYGPACYIFLDELLLVTQGNKISINSTVKTKQRTIFVVGKVLSRALINYS